ncbi:hypothetical protein Angca_009431, partial [Angiostrongylus cantonensis]
QMSGTVFHGVPTVPTPRFSTFTTVVDPPAPLPDFVSNMKMHPTTPTNRQVAVPYPSANVQIAPVVFENTNSIPNSIQKTFAVPSHTPETEKNCVNDEPITKKHKFPLASTSSKSYNLKRSFKVIIVGDAGVGKTCLSFRFCCGRFPENTEATIGVDFRERSCVIERELLKV